MLKDRFFSVTDTASLYTGNSLAAEIRRSRHVLSVGSRPYSLFEDCFAPLNFHSRALPRFPPRLITIVARRLILTCEFSARALRFRRTRTVRAEFPLRSAQRDSDYRRGRTASRFTGRRGASPAARFNGRDFRRLSTRRFAKPRARLTENRMRRSDCTTAHGRLPENAVYLARPAVRACATAYTGWDFSGEPRKIGRTR